eukprot:TRINITY_DN20313_c0_g1_i1.p1 TRINITY_DN20313_c0_g1~~TRINITY_DN20313_c0_g1_i1.p1  ORF type:complete len:558 (-),score=175.61 TRINITY_DN20313_c0_g1_i1:378-2015(-)
MTDTAARPCRDNAEFLAKHVLQKAGRKVVAYIPLLRKRAQEGKESHGKRFTLEEVERAISLCGLLSQVERAMLAPTPMLNRGDSIESTTSVAPPVAAVNDKLNLRIKGTSVCIRAFPPRLQEEAKCRKGQAASEPAAEPAQKRLRLQEAAAEPRCGSSSPVEEVELADHSVFRLRAGAPLPAQTLRFSAGRAAKAAGIHPYTDVGELFLEFVYQDLPDVLLRDALALGVVLQDPEAERRRLLEKSGSQQALEEQLKAAREAMWLEPMRAAQENIRQLVAAAKEAGRLDAEEAEELDSTLQQECNLSFGDRHEDAAIEAYEQLVGAKVYGCQRRVSVPMPPEGPAAALASLPAVRLEAMPPDEPAVPGKEASEKAKRRDEEASPAYFRVTGFIDGLVNLPRLVPPGGAARTAASAAAAKGLETVIVEVKHRMKGVRDNIYDIVQACCYSRAFGLSRGHLVQCVREEARKGLGPGQHVGELHVTALDFQAGSEHRKGWDEHVLPAMYAVAASVYATRQNEAARLRLLGAPPEERVKLVGELCPQLAR